MRRLIARVRSYGPGDVAQRDALCELMRAVMHHVADEETVLLPAAERHRARGMPALGARMVERRFQLSRPNATQAAVDMVRGSPGKSASAADSA